MRAVFRLPSDPDAPAVQSLARALSLPETIATILARRGYNDPDSARAFLRPRLAHLHDPWAMAGMAEAVERLARAIESDELVLVHGDYDVDGVCGTALLVRALRELGGRAEPFVPHRLKDGYDFGAAGLAYAVESGARCVLTCDCGITAHETVAGARREGIDVIVTDHHTPPRDLPPAAAVLNPHRPDCSYPEQVLCGAGVAFKLLHALFERLGRSVQELYKYLDLVAIPTVADLVPLTGENRVIARYGLKVLQRTPNPGLRALVRAAGLAGRKISAGQISFILGPRLNAVGRMGAALRGVELLLLEDEDRARSVAELVESENRTRQQVDRATFEQAKEILESTFDAESDRAIVLASDEWHPGVIGIVASRVVESFYRPTVLIALDGATGRGSGRSIPGFHLYEALRRCAGHLEQFGGHRYAAGLSIRRDRVDAFREALNDWAAERLGPDDLIPKVHVDLELPIAQVTPELWRFLAHFGPFGQGNPTPVFLARNVRLRSAPRVVGTDHLALKLEDADGRTLEAMAFRRAEEAAWLAEGTALDLAYQVGLGEWQGIEYLRASVVELQPCEPVWAVSGS